MEPLERLTVTQAARILHMSPDFIRDRLQKGELPIGIAVRNRQGTGWRYYIYKESVKRFAEGKKA